MRECGVLLPVTALPSEYGIGTFSKEAYAFIDLLAQAKIGCWQILPLGPTGFGDSPYQSFSTYAGNPYLIDLDALKQCGLLTYEDCYDLQINQKKIDYELLFNTRFKVLKEAFLRFNNVLNHNETERIQFEQFQDENAFWLKDYCLYMAIKEEQGHNAWIQWPYGLKARVEADMNEAQNRLKEQIGFHCFVQYEFFLQWQKLHNYASSKNVKIIGDIPFYVAMDSADVWAHPELFQLDQNWIPTGVAGCPPDAFAPQGQLWGNPVYNWDYQKKTDYEWWIKRIYYQLNLYDKLRIDHFRGFESYYVIPYGDKTAENGHWEKGPGFQLFDKLSHRKLPIIAEDLGYLTQEVRDLVKMTGFAGMKVLQFAFDSRESGDYLPHNYETNCVVYTGTHDNDTVIGWLNNLNSNDLEYVEDYLGVKGSLHGGSDRELCWSMIRLALSCVADLCVIPIQDYLGFGTEARINIPSTLGQNWTWRLTKDDMVSFDLERVKRMVEIYGRSMRTKTFRK